MNCRLPAWRDGLSIPLSAAQNGLAYDVSYSVSAPAVVPPTLHSPSLEELDKMAAAQVFCLAIARLKLFTNYSGTYNVS